jgi:magnesium chelatase accessory protein
MAERALPPPEQPPPWWPHREAGRHVRVGALQWYVQRFGASGASASGRPSALLLHGTGASAHSWRHLAPLLADRFDLIAPDLPGHGFTQTPASQSLALPAVASALADLLGALDVRPSLVIGHSAGAAIAVRMALDWRAAPQSVVSLNGAILPLEGALGRLLLPVARVLAANPLVVPAFAVWAAWPGTTRRLLDSTGSRLEPLGERCYMHLVRDPTHAAGALRLMASWDLALLAVDLPRLDVPLTLVVGDADRTLPPSHADRVCAVLPSAQRVTLAGLGHLAHEEDAGRVAAAILAGWPPAAPRRRPRTAVERAGP